MIHHLLYISEKNPSFYKETMAEALLLKAQQNNQRKDVTGILIDNGRFFIQLLEGSEEKVREVYNRICIDRRHLWVTLVLSFNDGERMFPQWSMGLVKGGVEESSTVAELLSKLQRDETTIQSEKARIITLLRKFNSRKAA